MGHQGYHVAKGKRIAFADLRLGDVMAAMPDALFDASDVQLRRSQSAEPDHHVVRLRRGQNPLGDGPAPKCRLEGIIEASGHGAVKAANALGPSLRICGRLIVAGRGHQFAREGVGVEPGGAGLFQQESPDRTLAGSVHPRENKQDGAWHQ
ncbi:hypothetical protein D3C72_1696960 [compost metagenome]